MEFAKYKLFSLLETEIIHGLREKLIEQTYREGENVICVGEESIAYYIIKSGSAVVLKKMLADELEQVEVLGEGDGFGEDALINDTKQSVTVRSLEDLTVWKISRTDFDNSIKSSFLYEISPEDIDINKNRAITFLDVRMEFEHEEEHIPGSVNIPLDELRMRCSELDVKREYYVHCMVGCRSATAAFILRSQGFQAKTIKGGIMNWSGPLLAGSYTSQKSLKPT